MPNYCCNTLILNENSLRLICKNYVRKDKDSERIFDFELIEPIEDKVDGHIERIHKWGTKWVGYDLSIGERTLDFFTAWSPPLPIIKKLAELHKDFVFRLEYYETGVAFRGVYTAKWQDGEVLVDDETWDMTDEDYQELWFAITGTDESPSFKEHP